MDVGVIHHCIVARPRNPLPSALAMMPAMRAAPDVAHGGALALVGLAWGGTGPTAAT